MRRGFLTGLAATLTLLTPVMASAQLPLPIPSGLPLPFPIPGAPTQPQPTPAPQPVPPPTTQPAPTPTPVVTSNQRPRAGAGEMVYLYGTGATFGVAMGVWIDAVAQVKDPAVAVIAPAIFGAGVPLGLFAWDSFAPFRAGVPSTMATGMLLGGLEGLVITATQAQFAADGKAWSFGAGMTASVLASAAGATGGYFFGEYYRPDTRGVSLLASSAGWGLLSGLALGAGASSDDWKDGGSVGSLIGMNVGLAAGGLVAALGYSPSYRTQKWMWAGYGAGAAASSVVYFFYIGSDRDPKRGLIANSIGALAGLSIATIMTSTLKDDDDGKKSTFTPPFQVGFAPVIGGGGMLTAFGSLK